MTDRPDLESPPDPEPCSCDEALGLRQKLEAAERERDTFRDMARQRGDLLVTEVERRLRLEHEVHAVPAVRSELLGARADAAKQFEERMALESRLAEARNGIATLLEHCRTDYIEIVRTDDDSMVDTIDPETIQGDLETILSATPAPAAPDTSGVEIARQRLEAWKAGHLSAESALAHICGCLGVPAPAAMCRADTGGVPCGEQEPCAEHPTPEPWRVGTRIPEHVYIGDRPLVTMPTAELAALVVMAVNGLDPAQRDWMAMQARISQLGELQTVERRIHKRVLEQSKKAHDAIDAAVVELEKAHHDSGQCKVVNTIWKAMQLLRAVRGGA